MPFWRSRENKSIEKHKNPRNRCFFGGVKNKKASRIPKTQEIDAFHSDPEEYLEGRSENMGLRI